MRDKTRNGAGPPRAAGSDPLHREWSHPGVSVKPGLYRVLHVKHSLKSKLSQVRAMFFDTVKVHPEGPAPRTLSLFLN